MENPIKRRICPSQSMWWNFGNILSNLYKSSSQPTRRHDTVVAEKVLLTRDGEEEEESVGTPGETPGQQHHQAGLPQLPLGLNNS